MSGPRSIDRRSDPLDLFAVLAHEAPDLGTSEDLAEVQRAVTAMRRGQRLAGSRSGRSTRASWLASIDYRRAAAVGILSVGLLSLAAGGWRETRESELGGEAPPQHAALAAADAGFTSGYERGGQLPAGRAEDWTSGAARFGLRSERWLSEALPAVERGSLVERPSFERPIFENLMPSTASVYELKGEALDLVMVVDETLDV